MSVDSLLLEPLDRVTPPVEKRERPASLVVFSDDWGRHPSSCQHLVRQLLPRYEVLWVNTIGTRAPRLDFATMRRVGEKLKSWISAREQEPVNTATAADSKAGPRVANPRM